MANLKDKCVSVNNPVVTSIFKHILKAATPLAFLSTKDTLIKLDIGEADTNKTQVSVIREGGVCMLPVIHDRLKKKCDELCNTAI